MNILVTQKQNFTPKRVTPTCRQPTLNTNMIPLFHSELLLSTFFYHVRFLQAIWREGIMLRSTKEQKAAFEAWPGCTMCSKKLCDCNGMLPSVASITTYFSSLAQNKKKKKKNASNAEAPAGQEAAE